mgnify:CR=1 FL=1
MYRIRVEMFRNKMETKTTFRICDKNIRISSGNKSVCASVENGSDLVKKFKLVKILDTRGGRV